MEAIYTSSTDISKEAIVQICCKELPPPLPKKRNKKKRILKMGLEAYPRVLTWVPSSSGGLIVRLIVMAKFLDTFQNCLVDVVVTVL